MVVAGIHVDQPKVIRPRVVLLVPGEAAVAHTGVCRRRPQQEGPERLVHGVAVGHVDPGAIGHGGHVAQLVGVQRVERRRPAADLLPGHGNLTVGAEGHAAGAAARGRNLFLVVGEGRADHRPVRPAGHHPLPVGVIFGYSGAGWVSSARC